MAPSAALGSTWSEQTIGPALPALCNILFDAQPDIPKSCSRSICIRMVHSWTCPFASGCQISATPRLGCTDDARWQISTSSLTWVLSMSQGYLITRQNIGGAVSSSSSFSSLFICLPHSIIITIYITYRYRRHRTIRTIHTIPIQLSD